MSRHYETQNGLCDTVDEETQSYVFNQTMLRIKDPVVSLDFYTRVIGMKLYRKLDFPEMQFTLYFLAMPKDVDLSSAKVIHRILLVWYGVRFFPLEGISTSLQWWLPSPTLHCPIGLL